MIENVRWDNFINGGPPLWRRRAVAWITKGAKDSFGRDLKFPEMRKIHMYDVQKYTINYNKITVKLRTNVTIFKSISIYERNFI